MGYIYLITNKINGKQYVGQSQCSDIKKRWGQHKKMEKGSLGRLIYNAYKYHGIENFKFQLICICFDEDCDKYEIDYIKKYNTLSPNGYNLTEGGCSAKHSEETRKLMSEKIKLAATPEWRKRISERLSGENHFYYGKKFSEETKKKMGQAHKENWASMTDEQYQKISQQRKIRSTDSNTKSYQALEKGRTLLRKRVAKYSTNDEFIESYNSILEAATKNNIVHGSISKTCKGNCGYKSAGGFKWKYIE